MHAGTMHSTRLFDDQAGQGERTTAVLMHLAMYGYLVFPLAFVVPLVLWLVKRGESPFLDDHGREALNFHISLVVYILLSIPLILALGFGLLLLCVAIPLWSLILPGVAAYAASKGEYYRYPATIRFL